MSRNIETKARYAQFRTDVPRDLFIGESNNRPVLIPDCQRPLSRSPGSSDRQNGSDISPCYGCTRCISRPTGVSRSHCQVSQKTIAPRITPNELAPKSKGEACRPGEKFCPTSSLPA